MGQLKSDRAASMLETIATSSPDMDLREKAVFALTQMKNGDGVPLLIEIARTNRNAVVKKEAMVQLGRSKDPRAVKFFEDLLSAR